MSPKAGAKSSSGNGDLSVSASDRAIAYIKNLILSGEAAMGETLSEEAISRAIGVSRTPVREALQVLQAQGFVRIERYRGAIVTGLDMKDVRELYDLRLCLERHAIFEALRSERELDLDEIKAAVEAHEEALAHFPDGDGGMEREIEADRAFHFGVLGLHRNPRLDAALSQTWDQVVRCSWQIMQQQPVQEESLKEHRAVLAALEARDRDAALAASEQHLHNAMLRVLLSD
ncbi:MAG: GntR family transcriptional regulator [Solirubrobacterales bacterium]